MATRKTDVAGKIIDAALRLAADRGWAELSLHDIAVEAKVPLAKVYPHFTGKQDILDAFARRIDGAVLGEIDAEASALFEGSSPRDRLFDVIMRRLELLQPHKQALGNILYDQLRRPPAALCSLPQALRSMSWMLEAAEISTTGYVGLLRTKGLVAIYLATLRVWLRDDSEEMSKTMAALDGYLRRAESLIGRLSRRGGPAEASPEAA
jgi:AcrR family transcriptional regulator